MLKIKDNVSLKELEKFGFKIFRVHGNEDELEYAYIPTERNHSANISIYGDNIMPWNKYVFSRKIMLHNHTQRTFDLLYDLIEAGLVEKLEE
jgi:hypothetical protein